KAFFSVELHIERFLLGEIYRHIFVGDGRSSEQDTAYPLESSISLQHDKMNSLADPRGSLHLRIPHSPV
ncbi:MAG: hypothetical protein ACPHJ3_00200, partial [Rubripirellula sp.]